jgi:phage head maturation protease
LDPANPTVQEIRSAMDRGDIDQMSIGFRVKDQSWNEDYTERTIREVELFDVSIVTYPASPTTSAFLRSIDEWLESLRDSDLSADDITRAHKFFADKLPAPVAQPVVTASGLVVTDDLRSMWEHIKAPIAA